MWRTALGSPVVPELKTSTASSVSPHGPAATWLGATAESRNQLSRSVTRCVPMHRPSSAVGRSVGYGVDGPGELEGVLRLLAFHAGLRSTAAPPSLLMAWTATMNSGRFDVISATRSPGADTLIGQVAAEGSAQLVEAAVGPPLIARPHRVAIAVECGGLLKRHGASGPRPSETFFSF